MFLTPSAAKAYLERGGFSEEVIETTINLLRDDYGKSLNMHPREVLRVIGSLVAQSLSLPANLLDASLFKIERIFNDPRATWDEKYDIIFRIAEGLRDRGLLDGFDYYNPDTTYEADVTAFVEAVREWRGSQP